MGDRQRPGRTSAAVWLVFSLFLCLYLLTARGRITVIDGLTRYHVTAAIVERGTVSLPESFSHRFPGRQPGTFYSYYGLGQSLAGLPLYLVGRAAARLAPAPDTAVVTELGYSFLNPLMAAALCAVFFALCAQLGYSRRTALSLTLILGLGTILWQHSKDSFEHPQEAFLGLAGVVSAERGLRRNRLWLVGLSGLLFGAAILTRESAFFFLVPTVVYVGVSASRAGAPAATGARPLTQPGRLCHSGARRGAGVVRGAAAAGACLGGALPMLALWGWYNVVRSGSPLVGGYGVTGHFAQFDASFVRGLAGLLISPGKGLIEYGPVVLVAVIFPASLRLLWRRSRGLSGLFAVIALSYVLFYSRFRYWDGGLCWGPRYLLPIIPLALLPLGELLERPLSLRGRRALWALVGVSVMIQLPAVLVDHQNWFWEVAVRNQRGGHIAINSDAINSPLLRQWQVLARVLSGSHSGLPADLALEASRRTRDSAQDEFCTGIDLWWVCWPGKDAALFRFAVAAALAGMTTLLAWRMAPLARKATAEAELVLRSEAAKPPSPLRRVASEPPPR